MLFDGQGVTSPRAEAPLGPAFILAPPLSGHPSSRPEAWHPHHGERQPEAGSMPPPLPQSLELEVPGGRRLQPSARAPCTVPLSSCHGLKRRVSVMVPTFLACAHCVVPDRHLHKQPFWGLRRRACGHSGSKDGAGLPRAMTRWCPTRSARVGWEEGISWTSEERGGMNSKTLASESRVSPSPVTLVLTLSAGLCKVSDLGLSWLSACHHLGGCSSVPLRRQSGWCSER